MKAGEGTVPTSPEAARLADMIGEQAAAEAAQSVAEAQERAQSIVAAARAEADSIAAEARREGAAGGRRRAAELIALAEAEARLLRLRAREALIDAALHRARARLGDFAAWPQAPALVRALVEEALALLPAGPLRLRAPANCAAPVEAALRAAGAHERVALDLSPAEPAGVVIESADGRLRFDNRFEARLHREREHLRRLAAEALFGKEAGT